MSKEDAAKRVADTVTDKGGLYDVGWYLRWITPDKQATLDGYFTADELRAIADYMDANYSGAK